MPSPPPCPQGLAPCCNRGSALFTMKEGLKEMGEGEKRRLVIAFGEDLLYAESSRPGVHCGVASYCEVSFLTPQITQAHLASSLSPHKPQPIAPTDHKVFLPWKGVKRRTWRTRSGEKVKGRTVEMPPSSCPVPPHRPPNPNPGTSRVGDSGCPWTRQ